MTFLFDEFKLSKWAYEYCGFINDDPEIRKNITDSLWSYLYCKDINDDPEMRKNITHSKWAFFYCKYIKSDPGMKKIAKKGGYKL